MTAQPLASQPHIAATLRAALGDAVETTTAVGRPSHQPEGAVGDGVEQHPGEVLVAVDGVAQFGRRDAAGAAAGAWAGIGWGDAGRAVVRATGCDPDPTVGIAAVTGFGSVGDGGAA